jgi:hypothetical protein
VALLGGRKTTEALTSLVQQLVFISLVAIDFLLLVIPALKVVQPLTDAEGILFGPNGGNRGKYRPELEDSAVFGRAVPRKFYIKPTGWNASDQLVISVSGTTAPTGSELDGNTQCAGDTLALKQGDNGAAIAYGDLVSRASGTFAYQVTVTQAAAITVTVFMLSILQAEQTKLMLTLAGLFIGYITQSNSI